MGQSNYSLPVSVPVNSYGESLLGSSPQIAHTSISPRPSSSETDSGIWSIKYTDIIYQINLIIILYIEKKN